VEIWRCLRVRLRARDWPRACTSEIRVSTLDRLSSSARCGLGRGAQGDAAIGARNSPTFRCPYSTLLHGARYARSLLVALGRVIEFKVG
jgi:hypothetical protein